LLEQPSTITKITSPQPRQNRCEPPTALIAPGKRFINIVPDAPTDQECVVSCLQKYANTKNLDIGTVQDFKAKIEDFSEKNSPKKAFALALCWLYTTESWVYSAVNCLLRDDSPQIEILAPFMNALMKSYKEMEGDDGNYYTGITYRRTKLTAKLLQFYQPDVQFVWSAFTSTAMEFTTEDTFGDVLFIISVPEKFKIYALNLENISVFSNREGSVVTSKYWFSSGFHRKRSNSRFSKYFHNNQNCCGLCLCGIKVELSSTNDTKAVDELGVSDALISI